MAGDKILAIGLFDRTVETTVLTDPPKPETGELKEQGLSLIYFPIEKNQEIIIR